MSDQVQHEDMGGNPVSLDRLCELEPAWAASRLRFERAASVAQAKRIEALEEYVANMSLQDKRGEMDEQDRDDTDLEGAWDEAVTARKCACGAPIVIVTHWDRWCDACWDHVAEWFGSDSTVDVDEYVLRKNTTQESGQ